MELTRTFFFANSTANDLARAFKAPLVIPYTDYPLLP